jgi:hypothetical protein
VPPKKPVDLLHPLAAIAANNKQEEAVMGLDMYAFIVEKSFVTPDVDFTLEDNLVQRLHYWRKHHHLHDWMERLYVAKGGQNPDFNLSAMALNSADLDALETAIKNTGMPASSGLPLRNDRERDDDLDFIRKARRALTNGFAVFYLAWW